MAMEIIIGPAFSGKHAVAEQLIEEREAAGELGLVALSFTGLFAAIAPGAESTYRDENVSDSGTPRLVGYLLSTAIAEASRRELAGYIELDSPRRALQLVEQAVASSLIEVSISETTVRRRAAEHVDMLQALAPRAGDADAEKATRRCAESITAYYRERPQLDAAGVNVRRVRPPQRRSDNSITAAWRAALAAAKRGDIAARDRWTNEAKRMLRARGVKA